MNQRASHFVLGSAGQPYGSIYTKDYVKKEAENGNNQPKQLIATNPFRSSSVNNSDKRVLSTTNKTMFPAWDGAEMARMDPNKLAELKGHHFKLGGYAPGQTLTTHKDHYNRKQGSGEAAKNQEESKAKMRAHYHDFKEV